MMDGMTSVGDLATLALTNANPPTDSRSITSIVEVLLPTCSKVLGWIPGGDFQLCLFSCHISVNEIVAANKL